jgi:hypothetical protein
MPSCGTPQSLHNLFNKLLKISSLLRYMLLLMGGHINTPSTKEAGGGISRGLSSKNLSRYLAFINTCPATSGVFYCSWECFKQLFVYRFIIQESIERMALQRLFHVSLFIKR